MYWDNPISVSFMNNRHQASFRLIQDLRFDSMLDVGCGSARFLSLVGSHYPSAVLTGCDSDPGLVPVARSSCPKATILQGDFMQLAIQPNKKSARIVVLLEVLEHSHDPAKMLQKAARLAGDNGYVLVSIPRPELWHWRIIWALWSRTLGRRWLGEHTGMTEKDLLRMADDCGLGIVKRSHFFFGCISILLMKKR